MTVMEEIPVYYINLDSSVQRRASIETQLQAAGITRAIRVPAFDGRGLDLATAADCDLPAALHYLGRPLRGGEYGCYRSHLACLQRFCDSGRSHAVVFEDDADIDPDFLEVVRQTLQYLTDGNHAWDVVHLGATRMKISTPVAQVGSRHELRRAFYFPMLANALLWSRNGARQIVEHHARVRMPVDNLFREVITGSGKGYALWPAVVRTIATPSDIDGAGAQRKLGGRTPAYALAKQSRLWKNKLVASYRKIVETP